MVTAINDFFNDIGKLPSPPTIALKILEAVGSEESTFKDLARIIAADPSLTAQILKFSNSSLYGLAAPVHSLDHATALLGFNAVKNIALSFVIVQDFQHVPEGSFDMDLFWRRSITAAVAAKTLTNHIDLKETPDLFVTALLQDLGILIFCLADPNAFGALLDIKRLQNTNSCEAERQLFTFDHTEVGSHLLSEWGLMEEVCQTIRLHHSEVSTDDEHGKAVLVLQLADKISAIYNSMDSTTVSIDVHQIMENEFQLSAAEVDQLIDTVGSKTQEVLELFEVDPGDIKPFSRIMQEANEELGRLNFSYEQVVYDLKQAKQNAEQLAIELKQANDSLRDLVSRDGLTGLYNHRFFQETLSTELIRTERYKHPLSLLLLDIDFFKKVNDRFGHPAGDQVLKEAGAVMTELVRDIDTVARYGGEEFSIILPETGVFGAKILAQRLRQGVEQMKIYHDGQCIQITISIGIASSENHDQDVNSDVLIKHCDQALYRAKENGRNRVEV